jgi:GTP-binding protein
MAEVIREQAYRVEEVHRDRVEVITIPPNPERFEVERKGNTFYVRGEVVERLAVMTDMESDEALFRLQRRLKRMGVFAALQRAGAGEGSRVMIGSVELTWTKELEPEVRPKSR